MQLQKKTISLFFCKASKIYPSRYNLLSDILYQEPDRGFGTSTILSQGGGLQF